MPSWYGSVLPTIPIPPLRAGKFATREETYPSTVILDGNVPDVESIAVLKAVRQSQTTKYTPVTVCSPAPRLTKKSRHSTLPAPTHSSGKNRILEMSPNSL